MAAQGLDGSPKSDPRGGRSSRSCGGCGPCPSAGAGADASVGHFAWYIRLMATAAHHRFTFGEYVALEAESAIKHEFLRRPSVGDGRGRA